MLSNEKAKDARREYLREWRRKNPEKVRAYNEGYWARRAGREEEKRDAEATRAKD